MGLMVGRKRGVPDLFKQGKSTSFMHMDSDTCLNPKNGLEYFKECPSCMYMCTWCYCGFSMSLLSFPGRLLSMCMTRLLCSDLGRGKYTA